MKEEHIEVEGRVTTVLPGTIYEDDSAESDITALYLREAREEPLLTMDQEQELGRSVANGRAAARQLSQPKAGRTDRANLVGNPFLDPNRSRSDVTAVPRSNRR